jgi:hypothetical protein
MKNIRRKNRGLSRGKTNPQELNVRQGAATEGRPYSTARGVGQNYSALIVTKYPSGSRTENSIV